MDPCPCLSLDAVLGLLKKCDESRSSRFRLSKFHCRFYLRKHRSRGKLSFFYILFCFFDTDVAELLLIRFAEVDRRVFNSSENDQEIRIQFLGKELRCTVLIYYGRRTLEMIVLCFENRDPAAACADNYIACIRKCSDRIDLDDRYRLRTRDYSPVASS